jgi:hypothetical protein
MTNPGSGLSRLDVLSRCDSSRGSRHALGDRRALRTGWGAVLRARANDLTMRHGQVTRRFDRSVFVRSAPVPEEL